MKVTELRDKLAAFPQQDAEAVALDAGVRKPVKWLSEGNGVCVLETTTPPPEPEPPPDDNWKDAAKAAATAAGFSKAICVDWDYAGENLVVDTASKGGLGDNGILIIRFVPTAPADNVIAQFSGTQYPGTEPVGSKTLAISTEPADLYPAAERGGVPNINPVTGSTPKLFYAVGEAPKGPEWSGGIPQGASVAVGKAYYLNAACRNADGTKAVQGEMRVQCGKSPDH